MRFIFVYSNDVDHSIHQRLRRVDPDIERIDTGVRDCLLFTTELDKRNYLKKHGYLGLLQGYVRYQNSGSYSGPEEHNERFFREMTSGHFPLDDNTCNSFASFVFDTSQRKVILANDVIGFYPIYYYRDHSRLIISSHLLQFNQIIDCDIDQTGVIQRLTGPEFCNFGSRTILKKVRRLLPGEYIRFDLADNPRPVFHKFDNSLYQGNFNTSIRPSAQEVWQSIRLESELCFKFDDQISVGLSGGMDSRILLASLPSKKRVSCYTYGAEDYYETKIARACAQVLGAEFESFPEDKLLFPDPELLKSYVLKTEAVGINQWLSILENVAGASDSKPAMAIGESTEAIAGRNIKEYSSRNSRIKIFLGLKTVNWTPLNELNFDVWKRKKTESILFMMRHNQTLVEEARERVYSETEADLEQLYNRISAHDVKFVELLDELFSWYTHGRIPISNQLLILRTKFFPVCPTMSARPLRVISRAHPSLRLNSRLMDEIFRLPELKPYSHIPTAQIPFVGYGTNETAKLLIWGLRSKTDQLMIRLASLRNKPGARNRVLKSTNWASAYSKADPAKVRAWFSPDFVKGDAFIKLFEDRARQTAHPLIPFDIVSAAGLNIELALIHAKHR